jgi:hypothetical protein
MSVDKIEDWVTQDKWFQTRGSKLFANRTRWDWFLRKHRQAIASKGCIGQLGRQVVVRPEYLEHIINRLLIDEARSRASKNRSVYQGLAND